MWETQVWSRGWEDTLEKEMATHSNTLAWKIPWTEEHGRLQPMRSQRVRHNWANSLSFLSFCFIDYAKAFVWITTNYGKFFKRWEKQTTLPASWDNCVQVKKQQLEPDIEQQTGSKQAKKYIKAVYCYPVYLTYMQSISCKMPGWMKHKLESRLLGEKSITSDMQMTPPLW